MVNSNNFNHLFPYSVPRSKLASFQSADADMAFATSNFSGRSKIVVFFAVGLIYAAAPISLFLIVKY